MNDIDVNGLMAQMQRLALAAQGRAVQAGAAAEQTDFAALLRGMLDQVNRSQQQADAMARSFSAEEGTWDLPQVMVELQKARLSFQTLLQVRNRVVQAYQDIMNMPL
jgi:flagellar hook-basal body complex protein FliE